MEKRIQIGLVGDFSEKIHTLVALNKAIEHVKPHLHFQLDAIWIPTNTITESFLAQHTHQGFWVVPGSPYDNDIGVYKLIQWSRENDFPLLGTCGGFQYMLVEYARTVMGFANAGHAETESEEHQLIISKLSCSLKSSTEQIRITDKQSWLYSTLKTDTITGHFNCSYGVNPVYHNILNQYPLTFTAFSPSGEPRAFELKAHRFYSGTLFQPPLDSTPEKPNPLIISFFQKCALP